MQASRTATSRISARRICGDKSAHLSRFWVFFIMNRIFNKSFLSDALLLTLGSLILAFGLYNVHSFSGVTEGGTLGATLLLDHHFGISPSVSSLILNFICYALGVRTLGRSLLVKSAYSGLCFAIFYYVFESVGPLLTPVTEHKIIAALVGALFVGVGVGLSVRAGGAPSGDDALAMTLASIFKRDIRWFYLITDLVVLLLSLTYIPPVEILYSLLSVILSGQIIGFIERIGTRSEGKSKSERIP